MNFREASNGIHLWQCGHCQEWFEATELTQMIRQKSKHYSLDHPGEKHKVF